MKVSLFAICAVCALSVRAIAAVGAQDQTLWQIGSRDNNYSELAIARNHAAYPTAFREGVRFEVGKSDPAKDWPFIQPGPNDAWAGSREHPQQVVFRLDREEDGVFALRVDFVDVHSSGPPVITIRVNDASQSFRLNPGVSDASLGNPANGREQTVTMYVAGLDLKLGENTVTLTLSKGSWVLYDCISLAKCVQPPKAVENLSLRPTCLFKKAGGSLKQIVTASMDLFLSRDSVKVEVSDEKGARVEKEFRNVPPGRSGLEIEIPEVTEPSRAHLKVTVGQEVFEADGTLTPQKKWRIYMMPSSHLDIGYTGRQDRTAQMHIDNLSRALTWCRKYPDFVWDLEGSLVAQDYFEKGQWPKTLIEMAKQGHVGVMGLYGNELTGICSSEGLVRLVDYYDYLRRKYGFESKCAMMSDVPTMVATVPMILAGHGIKYLSHGVNATRARGDQEFYNTPHYWESPDGSRVLMWKAPGYGYASQITGAGDDGSIEATSAKVNELLSQYARRNDYPFDAILLHGGYSDNQPNGEALARVPDEWNRAYEYPKLIFTRGPDFFEHIERNFAGDLKTVRGDGGVWWEDGAGSSAHETALSRHAKEHLITAEKLAVLSPPGVGTSLAGCFADAWKNVLYYDEHTWGAAQSISEPSSQATVEQWDIKKRFADDAIGLANRALDAALDAFSRAVRVREDSIVVFNPSSWTRSESAGVEQPKVEPYDLAANSVPPLGYKVFPAAKAGAKVAAAQELPEGGVLENRYYRVEIDQSTGAVKSIYDKDLQRELVDSSAHGFNTYLYVTGDDPRVLNCELSRPIPQLKIETWSKPEFRRRLTPFSRTIEAHCTAPMTASYICVVTLRDDRKAIYFEHHLNKTANLAKEAGYIAFPFAFKNPRIRIEIPDGVIRPELDQTKAACRDWYAVQDFLTISDDSASVIWTPINSPLITLQDINRGQWYDHLKIENGSVFAYVFNNYWFTNYKASQEGPLTFRFAMTSGRGFTDAQAKRFGEAVQNPLMAVYVKGTKGTPSPASRSYVRVANDNIVVQAMKPARFTKGAIIRLREMNGKTCKAQLTIDGIPFKRAYLCNLAEDKLSVLAVRKGTVDVPCRALGLATVLLER